MHDRPLADDEYDTDQDLQPGYTPDQDPVSEAIGSPAYLQHHTVNECVERFDGPIARFPEVFDRFYFQAEGGPVLVDILQDGTAEQLELERARKRVEFKAGWCRENDRRYLTLGESDCTVAKVRSLLTDDASASEAPKPTRARRPAAKRGQVQRPKATV